MKKKMKRGIVAVLNLAVFYALFMGIAASTSSYYDYDYLDKDLPEIFEFYNNNPNDFEANVNKVDIEKDKNGDFYIKRRSTVSSSSFAHNLKYYVDARDKNGKSTWGNPLFTFQKDESKNYKDNDTIDGTVYQYHRIVSDYPIVCSTPAEHLMLVAKKYDDLASTWKLWTVEKVEANRETGGTVFDDVTNDPEFDHYSDNKYYFFKATKFEINAGEKLSGEEEDLFKGIALNSEKRYTGSYSVEETFNGNILKIAVANSIFKEFTLLNSSYTTMTLSYNNVKSTYTQNVKIVLKADN